MQIHGVVHMTTATTETAIAAPEAGTRLTVVGLHVSAGGATVVTIGFGADNQRVYNLDADSSPIDTGIMRWEGDGGTALTVTSTEAVEVDVAVASLKLDVVGRKVKQSGQYLQ
jgi:hypothetical protein